MFLEPTTVIRRPLLTEKSEQEKHQEFEAGPRKGEVMNRYTFEVDMRAAKPQIKAAIEALYGVKVAKVRTQVRKGENRRNRFGAFTTSSWKKAIVELEAGNSIEH